MSSLPLLPAQKLMPILLMWQRPLGCNSCSAPAGYACEASLLSEISEEWLQKLILVTRPRKWRLFNRKSLPVMMWCATILAWTYLQTQQTLQVFHMFKSKLRFQDIQFHGSFAWSCWPWTSLFNSTSGVGHLMVVEVVDPTLWLKELCLLSPLNHTRWKWHWKEYQNRHSLNNSFLDVSPSHQRSSALMSCLVLVVFRIVWFSKKEKSKRTRNSGRKEETRRGSNMLVVLVGNLEQKLRWKVLGPQQFAKSVLSAFTIEYFRPIDGLRPWDRCSKKLVDLLMKLWPTRQPVLLRKLLEQLVCSRIHLD